MKRILMVAAFAILFLVGLGAHVSRSAEKSANPAIPTIATINGIVSDADGAVISKEENTAATTAQAEYIPIWVYTRQIRVYDKISLVVEHCSETTGGVIWSQNWDYPGYYNEHWLDCRAGEFLHVAVTGVHSDGREETVEFYIK